MFQLISLRVVEGYGSKFMLLSPPLLFDANGPQMNFATKRPVRLVGIT